MAALEHDVDRDDRRRRTADVGPLLISLECSRVRQGSDRSFRAPGADARCRIGRAMADDRPRGGAQRTAFLLHSIREPLGKDRVEPRRAVLERPFPGLDAGRAEVAPPELPSNACRRFGQPRGTKGHWQCPRCGLIRFTLSAALPERRRRRGWRIGRGDARRVRARGGSGVDLRTEIAPASGIFGMVTTLIVVPEKALVDAIAHALVAMASHWCSRTRLRPAAHRPSPDERRKRTGTPLRRVGRGGTCAARCRQKSSRGIRCSLGPRRS